MGVSAAIFLYWFVIAVAMTVLVSRVAAHRNRAVGPWTVAALFGWPFALLALLVLPPLPERRAAGTAEFDGVFITLGACCFATLGAMGLYALVR